MLSLKCTLAALLLTSSFVAAAENDPWKPYSPPCTERENVFEFIEKPAVRKAGPDKYQITFAVKGYCDVTVGIIDSAKDLTGWGRGTVVRHLASGVLGSNAPPPFLKDSLKQTIYWNGKDDLGRYVKGPERLAVRVMLGLKPVFDRRLGGTSPYNLPGYVAGLAAGPDGAYVINKEYSAGFQHATIRKFDRDGKYVGTLVPPPAGLPEAKLGGMGFVEYAPGTRALHGPDITQSIDHNACYLPPLDAEQVVDCQPAVIGDRLFFANTGYVQHVTQGSFLHYIHTDGSTDVRGLQGMPLTKGVFHNSPRLAVSPDGKTVYFLAANARTSTHTSTKPATCVYVTSADGDGPATLWVGRPDKPGSDNEHLADAAGVDCDTEGRVYVTDVANDRVQVFSPEGKHLKTLPVDRPLLVCVHKKTGAIYVSHTARTEGKSVPRLTKFAALADPREQFHLDGVPGWMALDSWGPNPRLWIAAPIRGNEHERRTSVTIWEERGGRLEKIADFEQQARREPGWFKKWTCEGSLSSSKSICDPTREKLYYGKEHIFDLPSGAYEGALRYPGSTDDIAFDKRGYLHVHFNPCFFLQGVGRFDPSRPRPSPQWEGKYITYAECPYDYGEEKSGLLGVLPVKDQLGAKGFQDGLGVTMRGEVAVQSNIYFVPKMDDEAREFAMQGSQATTKAGIYNEEGLAYDRFLRSIKEAEKRGEAVFFIKRSPGIPLSGGTIWTFSSSGELRRPCAVIAGDLVNGVQMDESRSIYFVTARPRLCGDKPFLQGRGGHFGVPGSKHLAFTGTLTKTKPDSSCRILSKNAPVALDALPNRPPDLAWIKFTHEQGIPCWVEGAEWMYAGASPIVNVGCSCPSQRHHLDWYKRVYVPESYRHSFAVLDTGGNLIQHVGRYGNFDNVPGGPRGCRPGDTDIGMTAVRYIGGTDNYLCFEDWGERIVVLKLTYHAEETVGIGQQ